MQRDTQVEAISRGDASLSGRQGVIAVPTHHATDSRLVPAASARDASRYQADVSAKGEQFILASWATLATGLWLVIAPTVLGYMNYAPRARSNDLILGVLIASMGATRVFGNYRSGRLNQLISGLNVLPGIWLIIAPFVLSYSGLMRPTRNDIITGIAVIAFALWSSVSGRHDAEDREARTA